MSKKYNEKYITVPTPVFEWFRDEFERSGVAKEVEIWLFKALTLARNKALEEAAVAAENSQPARIKLSDAGWVEMTDDFGEHTGKMYRGEHFKLDHKAGAAAAIRALITEQEPK